jgi:hypothetical protein
MPTPNLPDDAHDLLFLRTVLKACLDALDAEDGFLNKPSSHYDLENPPGPEYNTKVQNARRRIRKIIYNSLRKDGEPELTYDEAESAASTEAEAGDAASQPLLSTLGCTPSTYPPCVSCATCQNRYYTAGTCDYLNPTSYQRCISCPCV